MRITVKQLSLFIAIVQNKKISKAADAHFLSQSAASMALAQLESQLGYPLFDRQGKKLILNSNGERLLAKAMAVIDRVNEIEHQLDRLAGTLKIGASTTIGNYILPPIIHEFSIKYPHVNIALVIANTEKIVDKLLTFEIDVGFIEDNYEFSDINHEKWREDKLVLFSSSTHRLAKKKKINQHDLKDVKWIMREKGSGTRNVVEKAFYPHVGIFENIIEIGSSEAIKKMVQMGAGISCLSESVLLSEFNKKELVKLKLDGINIRRNFYRLIHKEKYETALIKSFLKVAKP